ncbi:hypothetical protein FACS189459_0960 [Bacilli bacterium]|nr:hypothetical protein FACS189459_0960 [Bacilli bacterium]
MKTVKYFIVKNYSFNIDQKSLMSLYAPIISGTGVHVFEALANEAIEHNGNNFFPFPAPDKLLNKYGVSLEQFFVITSKLEALGLMETYSKITEFEAVYYFQLFSPKQFRDFISDIRFKKLLISKIGEEEFERMEFLDGDFNIPADADRKTCEFNSVFNVDSINYSYNFAKLMTIINNESSKIFTFSNESKEIIESYSKCYSIKINEFATVVINSLVENSMGDFFIDCNVLSKQLKEIANLLLDNAKHVKNVKIIRISKLFSDPENNELKNTIFQDYKTLNNELYLRAIIKTSLNEEHHNIIKKLQKTMALTTPIINLIFDYSLSTTNSFNVVYIEKMANSFNYGGIDTVEQAFNFLKCVKISNKSAIISKTTTIPNDDFKLVDLN